MKVFTKPVRGFIGSLARWLVGSLARWLVPNLQVGNAVLEALLPVADSGSWSFPHRVPKLELGNQNNQNKSYGC